MKNRIKEVLEEYIKNNKIDESNYADRFLTSNFGFSDEAKFFFTYLTKECLGNQVRYPAFVKHPAVARVEINEEFKGIQIDRLDAITFNAFYIGVITKGICPYNYSNFNEFVKDIVEVRKEYKKENKHIEVFLLKVYLNSIFGMSENTSSILSGSVSCVVNTAAKVIDKVVDFIKDNDKIVYYIDTDMIYLETSDDDFKERLEEFYKTECSDLIDAEVSSMEFETGLTKTF